MTEWEDTENASTRQLGPFAAVVYRVHTGAESWFWVITTAAGSSFDQAGGEPLPSRTDAKAAALAAMRGVWRRVALDMGEALFGPEALEATP